MKPRCPAGRRMLQSKETGVQRVAWVPGGTNIARRRGTGTGTQPNLLETDMPAR
jgi:hypothetical protein